MKNILCYGDSNTWGNIAGSMNQKLMLAKRFEYDIRWTGVLQSLLGAGYRVIEAGLNGRTTYFDETWVSRPSRNGLATLPGIVEMHYPLDLIIFMLGTNDLKIQFNVSLEEITQGLQQLIHFVKASHFGPDFLAPQILLIAPAPIFKVETPAFNLFFDEASIKKSHALAGYYRALAEKEQCDFLDAGQFVGVSPNDGIHIEEESHQKLSLAVMEEIKILFQNSTL